MDRGLNNPTSPQMGDPMPIGVPSPRRSGQSGQVMTGIILIVLGALFFADRLGWDWGWGWHPTFARLWPVFLIAIGVSRLVSPGECKNGRSGRRFGGGGWILVVGILMLLDQNDWMSVSKSWPLFIVAGGLSMLVERRTGVN